MSFFFFKQVLVLEGLTIIEKYVLALEFLYKKQRCSFKLISFDRLEPYNSEKVS